MSVSLSRPVTDEHLSQALRATVLAHPQLLLHLVRISSEGEDTKDEQETRALDARADDMNHAVALVSRLTFADVVRHTSAALDAAELTRLADVRTACNAATPSWYLQVSTTPESQYLTFACNHIFLDGRSVVHFFDDLVYALSNLPEDEPVRFVDILYDAKVDSVSLPPAGSSVVDLYDSSWWYLAKTVAARFVPEAVRLAVATYYGRPDLTRYPILDLHPPGCTTVSHFHHVHLDANQLAALLARCRAAGATMAPFLAACACRALDESLTASLGGSYTYVTQLNVCGRRFYPEKAEEMRYGLYVSVANDFVKSGLVLEESAAMLSRNLSALLFDRTRFWLVGLFRYVNISKFMQEKFDKKVPLDTVEVSNVGFLHIEHGQWAVEDFVFSQGGTSTHLTLSVGSTPKGGMNIVVSSLDSLHKLGADGTNAMDKFHDIFTRTVKMGE